MLSAAARAARQWAAAAARLGGAFAAGATVESAAQGRQLQRGWQLVAASRVATAPNGGSAEQAAAALAKARRMSGPVGILAGALHPRACTPAWHATVAISRLHECLQAPAGASLRCRSGLSPALAHAFHCLGLFRASIGVHISTAALQVPIPLPPPAPAQHTPPPAPPRVPAGVFGSIVGVGGGVIIVPTIVTACRSIPQRRAGLGACCAQERASTEHAASAPPTANQSTRGLTRQAASLRPYPTVCTLPAAFRPQARLRNLPGGSAEHGAGQRLHLRQPGLRGPGGGGAHLPRCGCCSQVSLLPS